jgi:tetratricopeptide (TPR) repeat protein
MIFCQRCKMANPVGAEQCEGCGTRLLLLVRPRGSLALEASEYSLEEHLLERISALEAAIARANDRFEQLLELAQQQATGSFYDHMMLEALTEILSEIRAVDRDELEQRWKARVAQHYEETIERERLDERGARILANHRGERRKDFAELVEEGLTLLGEGCARRGLRTLEGALALDERNAELSFTIGEYYFHLGKTVEATAYLHRALSEEGDHFAARLLLGLLVDDEGKPESAKQHLQHALALDKNSFAAHYGLGRILAREGRLGEALAHLKRALALKPTPEMHYLVGRAYWEQGRADQALKHLQKAVRLDPRFDAALYNLGLIYWQSNRTREAREHFRAAYEINPRASHYRQAVQARAGEELPVPPPLGQAGLISRRKIRVGESRFIELLRRDLNTSALAPAPSRKKS